jgi:hypothetical protein
MCSAHHMCVPPPFHKNSDHDLCSMCMSLACVAHVLQFQAQSACCATQALLLAHMWLCNPLVCCQFAHHSEANGATKLVVDFLCLLVRSNATTASCHWQCTGLCRRLSVADVRLPWVGCTCVCAVPFLLCNALVHSVQTGPLKSPQGLMHESYDPR